MPVESTPPKVRMSKKLSHTHDLAQALAPLPSYRTSDYSVATVTVTRFGTISVRNVLYTVPSRLVGCRLKVHVFDDRLVCHHGLTPVLTVQRRHFKRGGPGLRVVDHQ